MSSMEATGDVPNVDVTGGLPEFGDSNPVTPPDEPEKSGANDEGGNDAPNKEEDMERKRKSRETSDKTRGPN